MQGIPLRPDPSATFRSERRAFIRVVAALTLAQQHRENPAKVLARNYPDDAVAARILKVAQSPTTTDSFAPPAMRAITLLPMLAPASASARLLGIADPVSLEGVITVTVPTISQVGRPAAVPFVREGFPMQIVDLTVGGLVVGPARKLLIGSLLTNELQKYSGDTAAEVIGQALAVSCEQSMDALLFSAQPADDTQPAGILNGVAGIPASGDSGLQGVANDLGLLAKAISGAGINSDDMAIIAAPDLAIKLRILAPGFSYPILSTPALPDGAVLGVVPRGLVSAYDGSISIETSEEMTVHAEDATPVDIVDGGVTASPVLSVWQKDGLGVKVRGLCAWAVHPGAVAHIEGAAW